MSLRHITICLSQVHGCSDHYIGSESAIGTCYILLWYTVKSLVVLMTKLIGIVTPLVLRLVVVVALRLISYKNSPARLYHTQVAVKIVSYNKIHIVKSTQLQWEEGRRRKRTRQSNVSAWIRKSGTTKNIISCLVHPWPCLQNRIVRNK